MVVAVAVAVVVAVAVDVVVVAVVVDATQVVVALVVSATNNSNNINSATLINDNILLLTYSFTSVRVRYVLSKNETNRFKILRDFFMIAILLFIVEYCTS